MLPAEDGNARANSNALILGITSGDAMPAASGAAGWGFVCDGAIVS